MMLLWSFELFWIIIIGTLLSTLNGTSAQESGTTDLDSVGTTDTFSFDSSLSMSASSMRLSESASRTVTSKEIQTMTSVEDTQSIQPNKDVTAVPNSTIAGVPTGNTISAVTLTFPGTTTTEYKPSTTESTARVVNMSSNVPTSNNVKMSSSDSSSTDATLPTNEVTAGEKLTSKTAESSSTMRADVTTTTTTTVSPFAPNRIIETRNLVLILWGASCGGIIIIVLIIVVIVHIVKRRRRRNIVLNHGKAHESSYVMFDVTAPDDRTYKELDFDPIDLSHIYSDDTSVNVRPSAFTTKTFKRGWTKNSNEASTSTDNLVPTIKRSLRRTISGPDVLSSQIKSNNFREDNIEISTTNSSLSYLDDDDVFR